MLPEVEMLSEVQALVFLRLLPNTASNFSLELYISFRNSPATLARARSP